MIPAAAMARAQMAYAEGIQHRVNLMLLVYPEITTRLHHALLELEWGGEDGPAEERIGPVVYVCNDYRFLTGRHTDASGIQLEGLSGVEPWDAYDRFSDYIGEDE